MFTMTFYPYRVSQLKGHTWHILNYNCYGIWLTPGSLLSADTSENDKFTSAASYFTLSYRRTEKQPKLQCQHL